jgi:hypothetical protein
VVSDRGEPVAGAVVSTITRGQKYHLTEDGVPTAGGGPQFAYSDAHGRFAFAALRQGPLLVYSVHGLLRSPRLDVDLVAAGQRNVELRLSPVRGVRGTLRRPDGSPAECVFVRAVATADHGREFAWRQAQRDGSFWLPVDVNEPFSVIASEPEHGQAEHRFVPPFAWPELHCELTLVASEGNADIRGRVVDETGKALFDMYVNVLGEDGKPTVGAPMAADGSFILRGLIKGPLRVAAIASGGNWAEPAAVVEAVAGEDREIVLRVPLDRQPTASITGRVVDDLGQPVGSVQGCVGTGDGVAFVQIASDPDGTIHQDHLPAGIDGLYLSASARHASVTVHIPPLAAHERRQIGDVRMPRASTVRVEFARNDGTPWTGPLPGVELKTASGNNTDAVVNTVFNKAVAQTVFSGLGPGDYCVTVSEADLLAEPVLVTLRPGETATTRLLLTVGRTMTFAFGDDGAGTTTDSLLHIAIADVQGKSVLQKDTPGNEGLRCTLPFGRYTIEGKGDGGLRYRAEFALGTLDDPDTITVPGAR